MALDVLVCIQMSSHSIFNNITKSTCIGHTMVDKLTTCVNTWQLTLVCSIVSSSSMLDCRHMMFSTTFFSYILDVKLSSQGFQSVVLKIIPRNVMHLNWSLMLMTVTPLNLELGNVITIYWISHVLPTNARFGHVWSNRTWTSLFGEKLHQ